MLDLKYVTEHLDEVRARLETRGDDLGKTLDQLGQLALARRAGIQQVEALRAQKNEASKALASADKKSEQFQKAREQLKELGATIKKLEQAQKEVEEHLETISLHLPNVPADETPLGKSEEDNVVVRVVGEAPSFDFEPKDHHALGTGLGILDFERGAKISGARFSVLVGAASRLTRALIQLMMDLHTDQGGYTELWPPALVRAEALLGTSQLPKFAGDVFRIADWGAGEGEGHALYLSPTSEVQVTNFHQNEILDGGSLPLRYCAYSACFRSEAGSYGKDTRGLIRQHQFDKVELVHFVRPEDAQAEHERLVQSAESVLTTLGLHYRVMDLCTADIGFGAKRCFDLEVWLPGQQKFREISSCSWFGDFQARRAKIRFRPEPKQKPQHVHTLNGSGLAVGRTLVAILEQYQEADGSVRIPEALRSYLGGKERITADGLS